MLNIGSIFINICKNEGVFVKNLNDTKTLAQFFLSWWSGGNPPPNTKINLQNHPKLTNIHQKQPILLKNQFNFFKISAFCLNFLENGFILVVFKNYSALQGGYSGGAFLLENSCLKSFVSTESTAVYAVAEFSRSSKIIGSNPRISKAPNLSHLKYFSF